MEKKSVVAQKFLAKNEALFACPLCRQKVGATATGLVCANGHRFDLSKKGTFYFLEHAVKSEYTNDMLAQRQNIIASGLYDPMLEKMAAWLPRAGNILDVGCGEGSFLARLGKNITGAKIGFDISKEGIYLASGQPNSAADYFWCVADLTRLPFAAKSFDTVLNIFSPSHYDEFARVLQPGGQLLKVIPGAHYLKELRESLYTGDKSNYSNAPVLDKLAAQVTIDEQIELTYKFPTSQLNFAELVHMTPLSWSAEPEKVARLLQNPFESITIDLILARCHY